MKISAKQAGGFAGGAQCYELDTACRADGGSVEALVHGVDFFGAAPMCVVGADMPRWEITVEDGGRTHTVVLVDDGSLGATGWAALLGRLRGAA